MSAQTIDDVIQQLNNIIDRAYSQRSRLGYFAALYRNVTIGVKEGIAEGIFEDGERMERLDVIFANFYLQALTQYQNNRAAARSWKFAFDASKRWWPIVLQHLLLGMNAHINLDLGVAAARTSPGDAIQDLENDFMKINEILSARVDEVEQQLARVWPVLKLLDYLGGRTDEALINFSITKARDHAWKVAQDLAPLAQPDQVPRIEKLDRDVAVLSRLIRNPGLIAGTVTKAVRIGERGSIPEIIDILG